MLRDPGRNREVKRLSAKFRRAIIILNDKYGNNGKSRDFLNSEFDLDLKESKFCKLHSAHVKKDYIKDVNEPAYTKIFKVLDPYIETEFGLIWNENEKKYSKIITKVVDPRLEGLIGTYQCYSWDAVTTKITEVDHIHVFKVTIESVTSASCETKGAIFQGNRMEIIASDRVALELSNAQRKIFIVLQIGYADIHYLKKQKSFTMAYTDSGNSKVKSGLAIMERIDLISYENMTPESKTVDNFDEKIVSRLRNQQLVIY